MRHLHRAALLQPRPTRRHIRLPPVAMRRTRRVANIAVAEGVGHAVRARVTRVEVEAEVEAEAEAGAERGVEAEVAAGRHVATTTERLEGRLPPSTGGTSGRTIDATSGTIDVATAVTGGAMTGRPWMTETIGQIGAATWGRSELHRRHQPTTDRNTTTWATWMHRRETCSSLLILLSECYFVLAVFGWLSGGVD